MKKKPDSHTISKPTGNKPSPLANGEVDFPIVAIGASAGGLEAITEFLGNIGADTGMAFIYLQHLSPEHKSMLTSILSKTTRMKVIEVEDKMQVLPNIFYVVPPDKEMKIFNGKIELKQRPNEPKINLPINILFSSLAESHGEVAIGIILSGSANDGTLGMKSIKQYGGLTFAQDESAKFNSMPKSAIASGVVDYILSSKEIALELKRLGKLPYVPSTEFKIAKEDLIDDNDPYLQIILQQIGKMNNVDFSSYKKQTIKRRILRRMIVFNIKKLKDYAEMIGEKDEEKNLLFQDLLINVSSFFRDKDIHQYLESTLFPRILKNKAAGETLRIWVPACSTGEEVYSIAMMLKEIQHRTNSDVAIQIFATDLSEKAIQKARIGRYTKAELEPVLPNRIQRFFSKSSGDYIISKNVRDLCVFAYHNILVDPPFSRLDFISCRNLFIYFDMQTQKKVLSTFQYALNKKGYLMLGKAETIGTSAQLFTEVHKKYRIYSKKENSTSLSIPELSKRSYPNVQPVFHKKEKTKSKSSSNIKSSIANKNLDAVIDSVIIAKFMPPSVVINHQMEILQFRGDTDIFFSHSQGRASLNVLKLARSEIAFGLRRTILKVIKTNRKVRENNIEIIINSEVYTVGFEVIPLELEWDEPLMLILFSEQKKENKKELKGTNTATSIEKDLLINDLKEELSNAHTDALAFSQEQEAFIEELQSEQEEVVSSNEELQTVNEELETSKEEIESTNEELIIANQELQTRNDLLNESYDYSNAIIATLHEPMIVLDKDLRIKTANKSFHDQFDVAGEEIEGMYLYAIANEQWNIPRLRELLDGIIIKNNYFHEFEVKHTFPKIGEKILMLNASRIEQKSHGEKLILLSIKDITEVVKFQLMEKEILNKDIERSKSTNILLEKAVRKRTIELKQNNFLLAAQNSELEKMNQELEAFTYISSHDLQEPLRKIQTFSDRLLNTEYKNLSESGKNYFQKIQNSAKRMQELIHDLIEYTRVSHSDTKFEVVDLRLLINNVVGEFKEQIEENHTTIDLKGNCNIRTIPFLFRQVLTNLISNSFKFAKSTLPLHITIDFQQIKTKKNNPLKLPYNKVYCHIKFTDNGIGFDKKFSEKIFQLFQKLHNKMEYEGTGIGLAIVKKIVESHNGIIQATSAIGQGTTFDIYLPLD